MKEKTYTQEEWIDKIRKEEEEKQLVWIRNIKVHPKLKENMK